MHIAAECNCRKAGLSLNSRLTPAVHHKVKEKRHWTSCQAKEATQISHGAENKKALFDLFLVPEHITKDLQPAKLGSMILFLSLLNDAV